MNVERERFRLSVILEAPLPLMIAVAVLCTLAVIGATIWTVI